MIFVLWLIPAMIWNYHVKAAMSNTILYQTAEQAWVIYIDTQWNEFEMWTITYTDTWWNSITILDRNLWAIERWTWVNSYWYHFQWWNNYWFQNDITPKTSSTKVDTNNYFVSGGGTNLQALIDTLRTIQYIGEVEINESASRVLPDKDLSFVYFTGATNGTSSLTDYDAAIEVLKTEDIQIIATPETNQNVLNLISAHCVEMSAIEGKKERTFWCGLSKGTTVENGTAYANSLNTDLGSVVIDSAIAVNPLTGASEEISPSLVVMTPEIYIGAILSPSS